MTKPAKILITGADGFIGSHLTEAFVRAGYAVRDLLFEKLLMLNVTFMSKGPRFAKV